MPSAANDNIINVNDPKLIAESIRIMTSEITDMSTSEFIDKYCYIENKDKLGEPVIRFKLWDSQKQALKELEEHRKVIVLKARQIGMTWIIVCYIVHRMIKYNGFKAICLSQKEDMAKHLVDRMELVIRYLPDWLIVEHSEYKKLKKGGKVMPPFYYIKTTDKIEIIRKYGEKSEAKGIAATIDAARSITGDLVLFDEWAYHKFANETYTAVYPIIARPDSGQFFGISTNFRGSKFEDVWRTSTIFHRIFLNCFADPRRTLEWYQEQVEALGEKVQREFPRTEEEALRSGVNVAFPEFTASIHVCEPFTIPEHWKRFGAVDNGHLHPYAWYKFAVSEDGIVFVYYEQSRLKDEPQVIYSDQAREFEAQMYYLAENGEVAREKLAYIVAGLDAWHSSHRDDLGKNLINYYREGGLNNASFIQATTDRRLRKATLHQYLKPYKDENTGRITAKLQIFSTCKYLIATLPELVRDDNDPEKVAVMDDIDNQYDALGYGLISHHAPLSKQKKESTPKTELQEYRERLMRQNRRRLRRWNVSRL